MKKVLSAFSPLCLQHSLTTGFCGVLAAAGGTTAAALTGAGLVMSLGIVGNGPMEAKPPATG